MGTNPEPLIRIDLETILQAGQPVIVEVGCGAKKMHGRIGVDRVDLPTVDIVADIEKGLPFLPDRSVDEIHCRSVLEHIEHFEHLFSDMIRVLKDTGAAHIFVPHFSNPYYYSDYTHRRFFGLYSFHYFVDEKHQLGRKVPSFYTDLRIEIVSLKLKFRSPFRAIHMMRTFFGAVINIHPSLQEFYEGNLCYLVPCDGIEIAFRPARR